MVKKKTTSTRLVTKGDIEPLKTDVGVLKTDVGVLKTDMKGLKRDVKRLDKRLNSRITSEIRGLRFELLDKIDESKEEMKGYIDKKIDIVLTHIDGFAGVYKKVDEEQTIIFHRQEGHSDKLENHEVRIVALEKGSAPG